MSNFHACHLTIVGYHLGCDTEQARVEFDSKIQILSDRPLSCEETAVIIAESFTCLTRLLYCVSQ